MERYIMAKKFNRAFDVEVETVEVDFSVLPVSNEVKFDESVTPATGLTQEDVASRLVASVSTTTTNTMEELTMTAQHVFTFNKVSEVKVSTGHVFTFNKGLVASASSEVTVNVSTKIEEEVKMTTVNNAVEVAVETSVVVTAEQKAKNELMWARNEGDGFNVLVNSKKEGNFKFEKTNQVVEETFNNAMKYVSGLGENVVEVVAYDFDSTKSPKAGKGGVELGSITVQFAPGYALIKSWDADALNAKGEKGAFVEVEACSKNVSSKGKISAGTGLVEFKVLRWTNSGEMSVFAPTSYSKKTQKNYPILSLKDVRFPEQRTFVMSKNVARLEAALTALVRMLESEHKETNNENRFIGTPSCNTCQHSAFLGTKDKVLEEGKQSSNVIEQLTTDLLTVNGGNFAPNRFCTLNLELVDAEAARTMNKANENDASQMYQDENGVTRFLPAGHLLIGGKAVRPGQYRAEATADKCLSCPFYAAQGRKSESQIVKEIKSTDGKVYGYQSEAIRAGGIQLEVEVDGKFVRNAYISEVEGNVTDFRLRTVGGLVVKFANELKQIMAEQDCTFADVLQTERMVEEFDASKHTFNKAREAIFYVAFNRNQVSDEQVALVKQLAANFDLSTYTEKQKEQFATALHWLAESDKWEMEKSKAGTRTPFLTRFTTKKWKDGIESTVLNAEEIMSEVLYGDEHGFYTDKNNLDSEGATHWSLVPGEEFLRYINKDLVSDFVIGALIGERYTIKGNFADKCAIALQQATQSMLNNLIYGINVAKDEVTEDGTVVNGAVREFEALKLDEKVMVYIKKNCADRLTRKVEAGVKKSEATEQDDAPITPLVTKQEDDLLALA